MSELLNHKAAAERRGCTRHTIHNAIRDGRLNAQLVGGRRFVRPVDVDSFQIHPTRPLTRGFAPKEPPP